MRARSPAGLAGTAAWAGSPDLVPLPGTDDLRGRDVLPLGWAQLRDVLWRMRGFTVEHQWRHGDHYLRHTEHMPMPVIAPPYCVPRPALAGFGPERHPQRVDSRPPWGSDCAPPGRDDSRPLDEETNR